MIHSTTDYHIFKFRSDNRDDSVYENGVDMSHVKRIAASITQKNMLAENPIIVNENFEVIDGQHRLKAAEMLNLPIYYIVHKNIDIIDMIKLNNTKKIWKISDYLNVWKKNGNQNYIKLDEFVKRENVALHIASYICSADSDFKRKDFEEGRWIFNDDLSLYHLQACKRTLNKMRSIIRDSRHIENVRFWKAILKVVTYPDFNVDNWLKNIELLPEHLGPRARYTDHLKDFQYVYNYRLREKNKIKLIQE